MFESWPAISSAYLAIECARNCESPPYFCGARQASIVRDDPTEPAAVKLENTTVQPKDSLTVNLVAGGGFIARFETGSKTP